MTGPSGADLVLVLPTGPLPTVTAPTSDARTGPERLACLNFGANQTSQTSV